VFLVHFLPGERFCPPKGEHPAEEFTINIIALRLEAYRKCAELPRPHLLTLVARKTGSPASHLVSQTPDLDPQNTCEACQRPTTLTPFRTKPRYSTHELNTTAAVSLTDERLCPPKGEHSAEEFTINIIALRLKAYREYAELPRLHLLTLVARKTGSPASHLVSQTPDLDPQNT